MKNQHSYGRSRQRMVEQQLRARGIKDSRVLQAMLDVPRHLFVPAAIQTHAYSDSALPIGEGQTISQPYMVARMCALLNLRGHERVLEIGTGCGYHTAVLAQLCSRVYSIERVQSLFQQAKDNLRQIQQANIMLKCDDGLQGWSGFAPFDAIVVTAGGACSEAWLAQLKLGGVMLMPEGEHGKHRLLLCQKDQGGIRRTLYDDCSFVPLREGVQ
jgi:protein-L-isoaspartate(D-aspartate) O-methyltransferase